MDLRQLKYFQRIVAAGSISKAASELHVAQPALSQQMANLERELGVRLLVRSKRGVQPTGNGRRLLEHARTILSQVDRAMEDVGSAGGDPSGEVTLGLTAGPAALLAAPLLTRCRSRHPGIVLRVVDAMASTLTEWVEIGRVDLALIFDIGQKLSLDLMPVLWEEILLCGTGIGSEPLKPQQLARLPLVVPSRQHPMRELIERYARSNGIELQLAYEVDALPATFAMLRSGIGCAFLSPIAARETARRYDFDGRPLSPKLERLVSLARPQAQPLTQAAEAVRALLCDIITELVGSGAWPATLLLKPNPDRLSQVEIETIGF